jgi:hypothetical protein
MFLIILTIVTVISIAPADRDKRPGRNTHCGNHYGHSYSDTYGDHTNTHPYATQTHAHSYPYSQAPTHSYPYAKATCDENYHCSR